MEQKNESKMEENSTTTEASIKKKKYVRKAPKASGKKNRCSENKK